MKKKNLFSQSLKWVLGITAAAALFVGCKDYDNDIKNLQNQINDLQTEINAGRTIASVDAIAATTEHPNGGWKITFTGNASPQSIDVWNGTNGTPGTNGTNGTQWRIGAAPNYYWESSTDGSNWTASNPPVSAKGQDGSSGATSISVSPTTGNYVVGTTDTGVKATPSTCVEYSSFYVLTIAQWDGAAWVKKDFTLPKYGDAIQSIEFIPSFVTFTGDPIIATAGINYTPAGSTTPNKIGQTSVAMKFRLNPTGLDATKFAFEAFSENAVNVITRATTPIFTLTEGTTPVYTKATGLYEIKATVTRTPKPIPTPGSGSYTPGYLADQVALKMKNIKTDKDGTTDISTFTESKFINLSYKEFDVIADNIADDDNDISILNNSSFEAMNSVNTLETAREVNIYYNLDLDTPGTTRNFNMLEYVNTYAWNGGIPTLLSNYFANVIMFQKDAIQPSTNPVSPATAVSVNTNGDVVIMPTSPATLNSLLNQMVDIRATGYLKNADGSQSPMVADVVIRVQFIDKPAAKSYPIGNKNFILTGATGGNDVTWDNETPVTTDDPTITKMIASAGLTAKVPGMTAANFSSYYTMSYVVTPVGGTTPSFYPPTTTFDGFNGWVPENLTGTLDGKKYDFAITYTPAGLGLTANLPVINATASLTCFLPAYPAMVKYRPMWLPTYTDITQALPPTSMFIKGISATPWSMEGLMKDGFELYTLPSAYNTLTWVLCDANGVEMTYPGVTIDATTGKIKLDLSVADGLDLAPALKYINMSTPVYVKAVAQLGAAGPMVTIQDPFQVQFGMPLLALAGSNATMSITELNNNSVSCYMLNAVSLLTAYETIVAPATTQKELLPKTPATPLITNQVLLSTAPSASGIYGVIYGQPTGNTMTMEIAPGTSLPATGTFTLNVDPTSANFGQATWTNSGPALLSPATVKINITIKNTWNDGTHGNAATQAAVTYQATLTIKPA